MANENVLEVHSLNSYYGRGKSRKQILKNVTLSMRPGEVLGIVGESGSGKSTLAKCILGLVTDVEGSIQLHVQRPQMVFQDPYGSLNPAKTVLWLLEEPLRAMGVKDPTQRKRQAEEMLALVGLTKEHGARKPGQLSGGQRQRVAIGAALMQGSRFLVLDEPVSALDVTLQAQILDLLTELRIKLGLSYLFISHDLAVVSQFCDRVAVMRQGEIVEMGDVDRVYTNPAHPYTKQLLAAALDFE